MASTTITSASENIPDGLAVPNTLIARAAATSVTEPCSCGWLAAPGPSTSTNGVHAVGVLIVWKRRPLPVTPTTCSAAGFSGIGTSWLADTARRSTLSSRIHRPVLVRGEHTLLHSSYVP